MAREHIAILVSGLGAGGAERVVAMLARHWTARFYRVTVLSFDRPDDPVFHPLPADAKVRRLGSDRHAGGGLTPLQRLLALRRTLRRERPDVVISFLAKNNALALMASAGTPIRVVCCERNNPERQARHRSWNWLLDRLYPRAAAIVCQTEGVVRCIPARARQLVRVIPNPVEIGSAPREAPGAARLVAVGRLDGQKGFDLLIRAFGRLVADHPHWRLDIFGEGKEREALEALVASEGLEGRVVLRGLSPRPRGWIEDADLFVLPSRFEGFPNVLAEAMAAGLPVVAANCDFGPADLIEEGVSGLLVEPESVDSLATGLDRLMRSPTLRASYGQAARAAMRRFAADRILADWDRLLEAVVRGTVVPSTDSPADRDPPVRAGVAR